MITNCVKRLSASGNNAIEAMLAVPEDAPDELVDFTGRDIKCSMSLQGQAAFTFGNFLASLNGYGSVEEYLDGSDIDEFDSAAWDPNDAVGQRIVGLVTQQPYQGRMTSQIRTFKPLPQDED